jgi:hypothetical protein
LILAVTSVYRCRGILTGWQGAPGLTTAYFDTKAVATAADALTALTRYRGAWDVVKSQLAATITWTPQPAVDVLDVPTGTLVAGFSVIPPAVVVGTGAGVPGAAQVQAGLILDTQGVVNGKRLRGHMDVGPLVAAALGTVLPPAGVNTAIDAMGVALITVTPPAAVAPLVVWSRPRVGHAGAALPVLATTHAQKWFSLRSRRD